MSSDHDLFSTLPAEVRQALTLCGIQNSEQLSRANISLLWEDLKRAHAFFPQDVGVNVFEQLKALVRLLQNEEAGEDVPPPLPNGEISQLPPYKTQRNKLLDLSTRQKEEEEEFPTVAPASPPLPAHAVTSGKRSSRGTEHSHDRAIRNGRIFAVSFCALATLLLPMAFIGLLYGGFYLIFNAGKAPIAVIAVLSASGVCILTYLALLNQSICSVCKMPLFTFRKYARNRNAPRWPLLGYSLTAALHVLFARHFRCPACGTLQRLNQVERRRASRASTSQHRS